MEVGPVEDSLGSREDDRDRWSILLACVAVSFAGGFAVGRKTAARVPNVSSGDLPAAPSPPEAPPAPPRSPSPLSATTSSGSGSSSPPSPPPMSAAAPASTPQDRADIALIVEGLENGVGPFDFPRTLEAGRRLEPLHPFTFLELIFGNPRHAQSIRNLREKEQNVGAFAITTLHLRWNQFLEGIRKGLDRERRNLAPHIGWFATSVRADPDRIRQLTQSSEPLRLVEYLIQVSCPPRPGPSRV